jgi:hypothetical protein
MSATSLLENFFWFLGDADSWRTFKASSMTRTSTFNSRPVLTVHSPSPVESILPEVPAMSSCSKIFTAKVDEPAPDDRSLLIDARHIIQVELEWAGVKHRVAFSDGFHHAVFDAVVDHLGEVAGAGLAQIGVVVTGRKRF